MKKTTQKPLSVKSKKLLEKGRKYYTFAYKPREMIVAKGKGANAVQSPSAKSYARTAAGSLLGPGTQHLLAVQATAS